MDAREWNAKIAALPAAHILQSWEWGQFKRATGWSAIPLTWEGAAALVLERRLTLRGLDSGLCVLYVPRGPLLDWSDTALRERVLDDLQALAKQRSAIQMKIDPEVILGRGVPGTEGASEDAVGQAVQDSLRRRGWVFSGEQIQFRNTAWLDLSGSEEAWLARMKQKGRYNVRLAERKGVQVRRGTLEDLPMLYALYAATSVRDGFVIRSQSYYTALWDRFMQAGMATPLIAEVEGQMVAAVVIFHFAGRAWYLHGMSREAHRDKMPNHLLQWQAMRLAREKGCTLYDLWGAPDVFDESDSMWGVFRFKESLGGQVVRTLGAWDYAPRPLLYTLYTRILPRVLDIMRRRGKARTQHEVSL